VAYTRYDLFAFEKGKPPGVSLPKDVAVELDIDAVLMLCLFTSEKCPRDAC